MLVTPHIHTVRETRWADSQLTWGLVPTMGYLHEGHLALVKQARAHNDRLAVTIYVNPTQFAPTEDLSSYPRNLARDMALLDDAGVDLLFTPDDDVMYPPGFQTAVTVQEVTRYLEGAARPTHFTGVTTIVTKLFNIVQPHRAYFGQKDAQQVAVLRQMVNDLNMNIELMVHPIVREPDGLAMSSRNKYLSAAERQAALVLYRALQAGQQAWEKGIQDGNALRQIMIAIIHSEPLARLGYVSAADPVTLQELDHVETTVLFSLAVTIGKTRLIDNLLIQ